MNPEPRPAESLCLLGSQSKLLQVLVKEPRYNERRDTLVEEANPLRKVRYLILDLIDTRRLDCRLLQWRVSIGAGEGLAPRMRASIWIDRFPHLALPALFALSFVRLEASEDPFVFVTLLLVVWRGAPEPRGHEQLGDTAGLHGGCGGDGGGSGNSYSDRGRKTTQ